MSTAVTTRPGASQGTTVVAGPSQTGMNCEPLIDACTAGQILGVHAKTVKRLAASGTIPAMRIGKLWKFRASALDEWMRYQLQCSGQSCPATNERSR
jgi:excisionase family DNA binding protein